MSNNKNKEKIAKTTNKALNLYLFGFVSGIANGVFGAGGGIFALLALKREGKDQQKAQASSVSLMFVLCLVSVITFFIRGEIEANTFKTAAYLIPFGLVGAYFGTVLMRKFSVKVLKNIFALFMIFAGIKFLF